MKILPRGAEEEHLDRLCGYLTASFGVVHADAVSQEVRDFIPRLSPSWRVTLMVARVGRPSLLRDVLDLHGRTALPTDEEEMGLFRKAYDHPHLTREIRAGLADALVTNAIARGAELADLGGWAIARDDGPLLDAVLSCPEASRPQPGALLSRAGSLCDAPRNETTMQIARLLRGAQIHPEAKIFLTQRAAMSARNANLLVLAKAGIASALEPAYLPPGLSRDMAHTFSRLASAHGRFALVAELPEIEEILADPDSCKLPMSQYA